MNMTVIFLSKANVSSQGNLNLFNSDMNLKDLIKLYLPHSNKTLFNYLLLTSAFLPEFTWNIF